MEYQLVVYTALFGNYDKLRDPPKKYPGCKFICFTDQKDLKSKIWEIRQVQIGELSAAMMNRHYKFFPHLYFHDFEYSLYVDANVRILDNPLNLVPKYLTHNVMACPAHFERNCLYEEASVCIAHGRANEMEVNALLDRYRNDGFPKHFGLTENNIIYRCHNDKALIGIMNEWWCSIINGPKRDQLSLMYLCWKRNFIPAIMQESSRNKNKYFRYALHLNNAALVKKVQTFINASYQRNAIYFWIWCGLKCCRHIFSRTFNHKANDDLTGSD